ATYFCARDHYSN
nr:immunoglobulin heavy chain junction region [Mus musculus]